MVVINDFNGLTAVVTGASSGMGKQLALQLASLGCSVAICDVQEEKLLQTADECKKVRKSEKVKIVAQVCDVTNKSQIETFKKAVVDSFGEKVNILINNAGIVTQGSFLDISPERFDKVFDVSYKGVVYFTRAFLPIIVKQKVGYVLNLSSINAFWCCLGPSKWPISTPGHTPYSAAKSAVKGFTEALLHDSYQNFPHVGIASVHPGHIGTDIALNQDYKDMNKKETDLYRKLLSMNPDIGERANNMSPEEIGKLVGERFRGGGLSAKDAATDIINGMRSGSTRMLIGEDAYVIDVLARLFPRAIYNDAFIVGVIGPSCLMASKIGRPFGLPVGRFAYLLVLSSILYLARRLIKSKV
mmetsp:Transcript_11088/g.12691  ORF Transcript_11088/g.12691 Transcript_11088/m.12691 type:complete len:357 (-) Transcript_11088:288-1358(-)|eukprot:CAMPEP_0184021872 /NCGR_PEP_ID=MMETSP0954-20121128/10204_1 /TAXON_ID=627963 /ORGANISM="Aplanochytrium sp, Strain PBS07" /LENGTH=356 /DNA_ID=CAMNT_0026304009 /DNA_START=71 /DNA_END=1141 /DNA_ORIENTATION=+